MRLGPFWQIWCNIWPHQTNGAAPQILRLAAIFVQHFKHHFGHGLVDIANFNFLTYFLLLTFVSQHALQWIDPCMIFWNIFSHHLHLQPTVYRSKGEPVTDVAPSDRVHVPCCTLYSVQCSLCRVTALNKPTNLRLLGPSPGWKHFHIEDTMLTHGK